jgi:hypothetical protein
VTGSAPVVAAGCQSRVWNAKARLGHRVWHPGNDDYRCADRPGHPCVYVVNKNGKLQTIDFPKIENQTRGVKTLRLKASTDSGLTVQFFVVSGPAEMKNDDTIEFLSFPPRSKFPAGRRV